MENINDNMIINQFKELIVEDFGIFNLFIYDNIYILNFFFLALYFLLLTFDGFNFSIKHLKKNNFFLFISTFFLLTNIYFASIYFLKVKDIDQNQFNFYIEKSQHIVFDKIKYNLSKDGLVAHAKYIDTLPFNTNDNDKESIQEYKENMLIEFKNFNQHLYEKYSNPKRLNQEIDLLKTIVSQNNRNTYIIYNINKYN